MSETFASILVEREDALVTKADLLRLETSTKAEFHQLSASTKSEIQRLEASTKAQIQSLDSSTKAAFQHLEGNARVEGQNLEGRLKSEIQGVRSDVALLRNEMVGMRHELRGEIKQANIDQIRWLVAAMVAICGLLFAAIKLL